MQTLKYLYHFSSPEVDLVEVKRLDRGDAPLSEVYRWLAIMKKSGHVLSLDFKSMAEGAREFLEGSLQFNASEARLHLLGDTYSLSVKAPDSISSQSLGFIEAYLGQVFEINEAFYLRNLKPSDLSSFTAWVKDAEVIRYSMTKFHRLTTDDQISDWFKATLLDSKSFQCAIVDTASDRLIGYAGIAGLNEIDRNGEYYIFIGDKQYWGRGIASRVTKLIVEVGFSQLNLHRIFLTASSQNPGAMRAYEKAGFRHEGRMREAFFRNGEYSDKVVMGMLRSEKR